MEIKAQFKSLLDLGIKGLCFDSNRWTAFITGEKMSPSDKIIEEVLAITYSQG